MMKPMKARRWIAALLAVCCMSSLAGCQLAREDAGENANNDHLIGVFVTSEYLDLFDMEGYLNDNIGSLSGGQITIDGNSQQYQGRLYATLKERTLTNEETGEQSKIKEYVFENTDGIPYFEATVPTTKDQQTITTTGSDEAISDGHTGIFRSDEEDKTTLEGTIYISPQQNGTYYVNPVYQSADGRVYTMSGSGVSVGGIEDEGSVFSQTLDASSTTTENGKSKKQSISIKISLAMMLPPERVILLQLDRDSSVLSRQEYAPGEVPKTLVPVPQASYIIAEIHKRDLQGEMHITRELFDQQDETLSTFRLRQDGVCVKNWTQLKWPSKETA